MGIMIEHFAGNFPVWLSPTQISIIPVSDVHNEKALEIGNIFKNNNIRVNIDTNNQGLGKKIRQTKVDKIPYWIVIGDNEIKTETYSLEDREGQKTEHLSVDKITEIIKTKL
jgi:threonyl-tRNA synthetase